MSIEQVKQQAFIKKKVMINTSIDQKPKSFPTAKTRSLADLFSMLGIMALVSRLNIMRESLAYSTNWIQIWKAQVWDWRL